MLEEYGVENVPVSVKDMYDRGACDILVDAEGNASVTSYNLQANDPRSREYQIKTAMHEGYHAAAGGKPTDALKMDSQKWQNIEEVFAETSAHYLAEKYGIKDLTPAYSEEIVSLLPKLKQLDEFKDCNTLADFGKIAYEARKNGDGSEWTELAKRISKKKYDYGNYVKQYFEEIGADVSGYVDKIIENAPTRASNKESMIEDLTKGMEEINERGFTLSDSKSKIIKEAVAIAMNRIGVK